MKYGRIDELRQSYPIAAMCRVLDVSESGYHAWRNRLPSKRARENARLELEIRAAHERTRQTYGAEEEIQSYHEFKAQSAGGAEPLGSPVFCRSAKQGLGD